MFGYLSAGPYFFSTTIQFKPKPGLLASMGFAPNFSAYEKLQIDQMMRQQEGPYSIINKTSDANNNIYYIVGGQSLELVNDSLARIRPYIEKFSDISYVLPQAIKETASDVGAGAASVVKVVAESALNIAAPVVKAMMPYILAGVVLAGSALYLYGQGAKKVRRYVSGG
jgi:hypothetical protein